MSTAMERYQGVILIRLQNAGSKSEGHYAFLVRDDDMSVVNEADSETEENNEQA